MSRGPFDPPFASLPPVIPIFPLSGAVVLPGTQLPLNIFEPRYLNLVHDLLGGHRVLGMVQPRSPEDAGAGPVHQVGGAGRIVSFSETGDGRYLIVLRGLCRFRVGQELDGVRGYRLVHADWSPFREDYVEDLPLPVPRDGLVAALRRFSAARGFEVAWDRLDEVQGMDLVNLLAATLPLTPEERQVLVEAVTPAERAGLLMGLMETYPHGAVPLHPRRH